MKQPLAACYVVCNMIGRQRNTVQLIIVDYRLLRRRKGDRIDAIYFSLRSKMNLSIIFNLLHHCLLFLHKITARKEDM